MKKIICFSAPPGSGKDLAADYLHRELSIQKYSIAYPIKQLVSNIYGCSIKYLEENKDKSLPELMEATPRDCFKGYGQLLKKLHGEDIWIKETIGNILCNNGNVFSISDIGFKNELQRIVEIFGVENVFLIYIHRSGYGFDKDSRNYVPANLRCLDSVGTKVDYRIKYVWIFNDSTVAEFLQKVKDEVVKFLYESKTDKLPLL